MFLFKVQSGPDSKNMGTERSSIDTFDLELLNESISLLCAFAGKSLHHANTTRVFHKLRVLWSKLFEPIKEILTCRCGILAQFVFFDHLILSHRQVDSDGIPEESVVMSHGCDHLGLFGVIEAARVHLLGESDKVGRRFKVPLLVCPEGA